MDIIDMDRYKIPKTTVFLFFAFISLLLYANCLNGDFLMDDKILIVDNNYIKSIKTLPLLFATHVFNFSAYSFENTHQYYRPLQALSFAFDYHIWKLRPFGYHLTNVIIHALNAR